MEKASDAARAVAAIVAAVADGEVTPGEAAELSRLVEKYANILLASRGAWRNWKRQQGKRNDWNSR
jgi:hypothetical protein